MKVQFIILVTCLFLCGCRKEVEHFQAKAVYDTGIDTRINDLAILSDTLWIACGGKRNEEGYFLRSSDQGMTWSVFQTEFNRSIYSLAFTDTSVGLAGGDYLDLWKTNDNGITWQYHWLGDQVPFNEEDRPAIRRIKLLDPGTWYFCGGENLGEGVFYKSTDHGSNWDFFFTTHEYRALGVFADGSVVTGGHGEVMHIDVMTSPQRGGFSDDFITCLSVISDRSCIAMSATGKIYESPDEGLSWSVKSNDARTNGIFWHDLDTDGRWIAVGNDGMIAESKDHGSSWKLSQLSEKPHLYSVTQFANRIFATSDNGIIYELE